MQTTDTSDYQIVLDAIRIWPAARRLTLVQDVLKTLVPVVETNSGAPDDAVARRREALTRLRGIGATGASPPSDAEVQEWLAEERLKKYG